MVVVNIVGFPYKIRLRSGIEIVIPYDHQPHEVPDEIAENNFNNVFQVLIPPRPKIIVPIVPTIPKIIVPIVPTIPIQKAQEIIEINLEYDEKIEEKPKDVVNTIQEIKEEIKQTPLKGIKIKTAKRDKLIKKGKTRKKNFAVLDTLKEETNNGNN